MVRNSLPELVRIPELIERHAVQVAQFENWDAGCNWHEFHVNHYDWWASPINKPSSYDFSYTVYSCEIAVVRQDEAFMQLHRHGAQLLLPYGWDFFVGAVMSDPAPGHAQANLPIRSSNCARHIWLFSQVEQYESCVEYDKYLKAEGRSFWCKDRDLFDEIVVPHHD